MRDLLNSTIWKSSKSHRGGRSVHQLSETCNSQITFWNSPTRIIATLFTPILAAKNAVDLERLACFTAKELNLTSAVISDLVYNVDNIRHAVLQNRAAIDFILLAQGHGCEDLSGMCCFNLSDHLESIHKRLMKIKDNIQEIQIETNPITEGLKEIWETLTSWLPNFTWLKKLFVSGIVIIFLLALTCIAMRCVLWLCKTSGSKSSYETWKMHKLRQKVESGSYFKVCNIAWFC